MTSEKASATTTSGEYDSLDWVSRVARGIVEHGQSIRARGADRCNQDEDDLAQFEDALPRRMGIH